MGTENRWTRTTNGESCNETRALHLGIVAAGRRSVNATVLLDLIERADWRWLVSSWWLAAEV